MADEAPLLFEKRLGGLFPVKDAAERALASVAGRVKVKITRTSPKRREIEEVMRERRGG
jgi:hypothetical protein